MAKPAVGLSGVLGNPDAVMRFMRLTETEGHGGCWRWTGAFNGGAIAGYGLFRLRQPDGRRHAAAHRASFALFCSDIPDGAMVLHSCDHTWCVNPSHLRLGTQKQNMSDMVRRNRRAGGSLSKLTEKDIPEIRSRLRAGDTCYQIAPDYGVSHMAIYQIATRKSWAHVPDPVGDGPIMKPKKLKGPRRRLSDDDIRAIRADERDLHIVAAAFKISETHCWNIRHGVRHANVPDEL